MSQHLTTRITVISDRRHSVVPENKLGFRSMSCAQA